MEAGQETRQPLKYLEIPLTKFKEEVIPHHQSVFFEYKNKVQKLVKLDDVELIKKEIKTKNSTVKQLRDLMYELDTLRTQVVTEDLDEFDNRTMTLRKSLITLISDYCDVEKLAVSVINAKLTITEYENALKSNPLDGAMKLQLQETVESLKLKQREATLNEVEEINQQVRDLHEMFKELSGMVDSQSQTVNTVETLTEDSQINVEEGNKSLMQAVRLKAVAYPITGALIGSVIGGPIGLVAGMKAGGVAAFCCALAGYTGGKYMKTVNENANAENENENNENEESLPQVESLTNHPSVEVETKKNT